MSMFAFSVSAEESSGEKINADPHYEYHLRISRDIDSMREIRNKRMAVHQKKIEEYQNRSMELYSEFLETFSTEN